MRGLTTVQVQRPTYLPPNTFGPAGRKLQKAPRPKITQGAVSDLSVIYPEAVELSSQTLGWQNICAIQMRLKSEWNAPPLENHCLIIQLGPPRFVTARINNRTFAQTLQTGEILILPAGTSLYWTQTDREANDTLHLYLHPHFVRATAESMDLDAAQVSLQPQFGVSDEHLHHIASSLHCELKEANVIGGVYADSLAHLLAIQLLRRYSEVKDEHLSRGGMVPRKLRKAIDFIKANLDKEQTVALGAVAQEVAMSYFHFSRAFKQSTGVSPNVYMIEQRIERAKKLLSETDLPITDVALRVGFASQSHFTTTFRRLAWTTPKTFREMA
ncbi:MAG TPA: AraC family transcriptional regulator [Pyrinomonadaceae bacterium]|nr:AraC family transcriptional regulator [Pyrinomonadaceae bacterium]